MDPANSILSNTVRFWLFLVALIPSVGCSIAILYHILSNTHRRHAIHNHFIIILLCNNLIYELTDISLYLNYYRLGTVQPVTESLCIVWTFIDETLYTVSTVVVAWASIERHIIIFHDRWLSTSKKRFFVHYTPYMLLVSYILVFHFCAIVIPPCQNTFYYEQELCGHPMCLHNTKFVGTWDSIVNNILPSLTIVIFSISLLVRVLLKNRRMRRAVQWRKHRKMAVQLLLISFLYFFLYIPIMCLDLIHLCCLSEHTNTPYEEVASFFSYYVIFLLPFVYLASLIENSWQIRKIFPCLHRAIQAIEPTIAVTAHYTAKNPNGIDFAGNK